MSSVDLQPSKLGTREHWDDAYARELANFAEIGDEGEVWFGEDSVEKMVDWALEHLPPTADPAPFILEVGTGNGNLLFALADTGYAPERMCGIDYSPDAVKLAQAIASAKVAATDDEDSPRVDAISFAACDFLREDVVPVAPAQAANAATPAYWDLVVDKGTLDAIALGEPDERGRSPADGYADRVARAMKPGGFFLIVSCNFTEEELKARFVSDTTGLVYHSRIPFPTFSFGGKSGNTYSSVAFKKPWIIL